MPGSFYEILGTETDASPEDIRRAYKNSALRTHPDRLPPGASPEDKKKAEEQFRKVNNAYEILIDPKNRRLYDMYGVWPPPEEFNEEPRRERGHRQGHGHRHSHHPFPNPDPLDDPFFNFPTSPFGQPFSHRRTGPAFRDPFELFNAVFADMERDFFMGQRPMFGHHHSFDPFPRGHGFMFNHPHALLGPAFPALPGFPVHHHGGPSRPHRHAQNFSFQSSDRGHYGLNSEQDGPEWVYESRMVRTINGVTQSVSTRKDGHGNEHVTYTYPDGREKYVLNGVEQPAPVQGGPPAGHLPPPPADSRFEGSDHETTAPVIPPEQGSSKRYWWSRHH